MAANDVSSARPRIAVVGAGPVGLVVSSLLSKYGVHHYLIEKSQTRVLHPQANLVNDRTMEILRGIGNLEEELKPLCPPMYQWRKFKYMRALLGHEYGSIDHFADDASARAELTPCHMVHVAQPKLMEVLMKHTHAQTTYLHPMIGTEAESFEVHGNGVRLTVRDGKGSEVLDLDYLVATDGAQSPIREKLGIKMEGYNDLQNVINIHFVSPKLGERILAEGREAMLYWVFNQHVEAIVMAYNLEEGEFVAQVLYYPLLKGRKEFTKEVCANLLAKTIGDDVPFEMKSIKPWMVREIWAERFSEADRVFLVGDAAHSFPPSGGFGMNTGIQDAHNLAWKLAAVAKGLAGHELMSSYGPERKAGTLLGGNENQKQSMRRETAVLASRGMWPPYTSIFYHILSLKVNLPLSAKKFICSIFFFVKRILLASPGPIGWLQDRSTRALMRNEAALRMHPPAATLGYRYPVGAFATSDYGLPPAPKALEPAEKYLRVQYTPEAATGSPFPHMWVQSAALAATKEAAVHMNGNGNGHANESSKPAGEGVLSTVDVIADSGVRVTLFTDEAGKAWVAAGSKLDPSGKSLRLVAVVPSKNHIANAPSGSEVMVDIERRFHKTLRIPAGSAVLVRPDGHILWRAGPASDEAPETKLLEALQAINYQPKGIKA